MSRLAVSRIEYWLPSIFDSVGGLQSYSREFAKEFQSHLPAAEHHLLLKNDQSIPKSTGFARGMNYSSFGKIPGPVRTAFFSLGIFTSALKRPRPLVICGHLHFSPVALLLKRLCGVPYWVICYGVESWDISRASLRNALENASRVISISEFTKQRALAQTALESPQCSVLPCPFDESKFSILPDIQGIRHGLGFEKTDRILLTVNRLEEREPFKAYEQVLAALPAIRAEIPQVKYVIVGEGNDKERLIRKVERENLGDIVRITGYVSSGELVEYYNACDLFVLPSKLEGFGIVFLEALACGKAVIAGNQDGSREAVGEGELGILVNPDDIREIAGAVVRYLRGEASNTMLYEPAQLSAAVTERYGMNAFRSRVGQIVESTLEFHQRPFHQGAS